jgi:hypothetical protein
VLEAVGIVFVALFIARALARRGTRRELGFGSGLVVAAIVIVFAAGQVPSSITTLSQTRSSGKPAGAGRDECVGEPDFGTAADLYTRRLPFALWARRQMGRAVYSVASFTQPPDDICLYFVLLPALPASPGERPDFTIAFGSIPPAMQAKIAAHDPAVKEFAPGFALESDRP